MSPPADSTLTRLASFEDILDEIETLARDHLLAHRLQLGALLLRSFWDDDASAFSSRDHTKSMRFLLFFEKCGDDLARYGLTIRQAQESIRAAIVVRRLPSELAQRLFLSQILELTRLPNPTARIEMANAALTYGWSVRELRDAVNATRAGVALEETITIVAPQPVVEKPRAPVLGRMVTRAEKIVGTIDQWSSMWQQVDVSRMRPPQKERLMAAMTALEQRVAALRKELGD